ncbi:MAG: hypothetical protein JNL60_12360 [Bacteroidia bacterium]|nr:hypothetical protein [Bacteroidia bacterium]
MAFLLRLKHWQLFVLLIGVPFILEILVMIIVASTGSLMGMFIALPIMMFAAVFFFFGWFYTLGTRLYQKLPPTVTMKLGLFKFFLFFPSIYLVIFSCLMYLMFTNLEPGGQPSPFIFVIIFPLHIFSMFCIFYCIYFNAKVLKAVELQRPVTFSDYAGEFFMIWMFPIGIWILQPRINKLFDSSLNDDNHRILDETI